jgi:hypothetical protein
VTNGPPSPGPIPQRLPERRGRLELQLHEPLDAVERVGEHPLDPPPGAVEVQEDGKIAAPRSREQHGRAVGAEQPPLDLGDLEPGIDGVVDLDELPLRPQGVDTGAERAKTHGGGDPPEQILVAPPARVD